MEVLFPLREWRRARGMTSAELAAKSGLSPSTVIKLETGERQYNQRSLEAIAEALHCRPTDLLTNPPPRLEIVAAAPWNHPTRPEGHYIKAWRLFRELTVIELAALASMSHGNLSRLERGLVPYNQQSLERLAGALDTDPGSLILMPPELAEVSQLVALFPRNRLRQLLEIARILSEERPTEADECTPIRLEVAPVPGGVTKKVAGKMHRREPFQRKSTTGAEEKIRKPLQAQRATQARLEELTT